MGKTRYDFDVQIDELLDEALNVLSNQEYEKLLDSVSIMIAERDVKFNPLWSLSEQEQITLDQQKDGAELTRARVAQVYMDMGILDPSEVRKKLATSRTEETMSNAARIANIGTSSIRNAVRITRQARLNALRAGLPTKTTGIFSMR